MLRRIFCVSKKELLQNDATAPKTIEILHPQDVGAVIDRPRATNRRPYGFYRQIFAFCSSPLRAVTLRSPLFAVWDYSPKYFFLFSSIAAAPSMVVIIMPLQKRNRKLSPVLGLVGSASAVLVLTKVAVTVTSAAGMEKT